VQAAPRALRGVLSGAIAIEGAEPGDLLVVDILDLGPVPPPDDDGPVARQGWATRATSPRSTAAAFSPFCMWR
jgi:formamidase